MISTFIAKISLFFSARYRVTILLSCAVIILGFATYGFLLRREGFPPVEVPVVLVRTPYFVQDNQKVLNEVTIPLESLLMLVDEVNSIQSTTTDNFSFITVRLNPSISVEEGKSKIEESINKITLSSGAVTELQTFNAGTVNGRHDLVFFLSKDTSATELTNLAGTVVQAVEMLTEVKHAEVIPLTEEQTNPITGATRQIQTTFVRTALRENNSLIYQDAISIGVTKAHETVGTLELSDAVRAELERIGLKEEFSDVRFSYGGDYADGLRRQITNLENNGISGLVAVTFVLFLFISFRASLVTALFIPVVMSATFIGLYIIGYTLNTIVLFSLILVLGLFVDDAIVVVEAIDYQRQKGVTGLKAVKEAILSIGTADLSGSITTVLVFAPMLFIAGILGDFISLIPITVILALTLSIIIALTVIPFLSYVLVIRFGATRSAKRGIVGTFGFLIFDAIPHLLDKIAQLLGNCVRWYAQRPITNVLVIAISIVLIVFGGMYAGRLSFSVFPEPKDADAIRLSMRFPQDNTLEQSLASAQEVERRLAVSAKYIEQVHYFSASATDALIQIDLTEITKRERTAPEIISDITLVASDLKDVEVTARMISAGPPAEDFQFAVQVYDEDESVLTKTTERISEFVKNYSAGDVVVEEVRIAPISTITKKDAERFVQIQARLTEGADTADVLTLEEAIAEEFDSSTLADLGVEGDGLVFDLGQESENLESFNSSIVALIGSTLIMYALLIIQFNSFLQPLLVLLAIPLSFPGLFPGLYVTNNALSFFVMLGIIGLVGIVVNNSIMLIDFANQARSTGLSASNSIADAVRVRFRPILATSATTIAGLLPLTLTDPFWEPLALSIIFGLISSSILVLVALPAFYVVVEKMRELKSRVTPRLYSEE